MIQKANVVISRRAKQLDLVVGGEERERERSDLVCHLLTIISTFMFPKVVQINKECTDRKSVV